MAHSMMKTMVFFLVLAQAAFLCSASALLAEQGAPAQSSPAYVDIFLSHQTKLSEAVTIEAPKEGYPFVNLKAGRALSDSVLLKDGGEAAKPLALAEGDFNRDGTPDLAVGYGTTGGGRVVLYWGNPDAIYPNSPEANERKASGTFTEAPFLASGLTFELPLAPDFMEACDFDGDGNVDLLAAARGKHSIHLLRGDGTGNLASPIPCKLSGAVTALSVEETGGRGGLPQIAVGIKGQKSAFILIFEWPEGGKLTRFEEFRAADRVRQLLFVRIDGSPGLALLAASGSELKVIHDVNRLVFPTKGFLQGKATGGKVLDALIAEVQTGDSARIPTLKLNNPQRKVERFAVPFKITAMACGNFLWSRERVDQIAFLSSEGAIKIFRMPGKKGMGAPLWTSPSPLLKAAGSSDLRLVRAKVSSLPSDDLLIFDRWGSLFQILLGDSSKLQSEVKYTLPATFSQVSLEPPGSPAAVLPMRLNADPLSDLVILMSGSEEGPTVMPTLAAGTWTVTSASNDWGCPEVGDGICNSLLGYTPEGTPICGGACTFMGALMEAMAGAGSQLIQFSIPGSGPHVIPWLGYPDEFFPYPIYLMGTLTVDATTQPGYSGTPLVGLDGYYVTVGAGSQATVRGLILSGSAGHGIELRSDGNILEGNYIGTNVNGDAVAFHPNPGSGVVICGTSNNIIGGTTQTARNVISGSKLYQVHLIGAKDNKVQGNYIGTNSKGDAALFTDRPGCVTIQEGSQKNQIVGNVISGCSIAVEITNSNENTVAGNKIGTNANGDAVIGNKYTGVHIADGSGNTIGGNKIADANTISGNPEGVYITSEEQETKLNKIIGNLIGTNEKGDAALGNGVGVKILGSRVKETSVGGNIISGTGQGDTLAPGTHHAVYIESSNGNLVGRNVIGLNIDGDKALGNDGYGVKIVDASSNYVGFMSTEDEKWLNAISGSTVAVGIQATNGQAKDNGVYYNVIGLDVSGDVLLGNVENGILLWGGAVIDNKIVQNIICGTGRIGNYTGDRDAILIRFGSRNSIAGNYIGVDPTFETIYSNEGAGVRIVDGSENMVGDNGTNFIMANKFGVVIQSKDKIARKNHVHNNDIGTTACSNLGTFLGNGLDGVTIEGKNATENEVINNCIATSGTFKDPTQANGLHISQSNNSAVKGNVFWGNRLGAGIRITNGSSNVIGGATVGEGNVIKANSIGVAITGEGGTAEWNVVAGNEIGAFHDVNNPLGSIPNFNQGVLIKGSGARYNTLRGNTIFRSGHTEWSTPGLGVGVHLDSCMSNRILGNAVGTNFQDPPWESQGNKDHGIMMVNASDNTIGTLNEGESNRIAFNAGMASTSSPDTGTISSPIPYFPTKGLALTWPPAMGTPTTREIGMMVRTNCKISPN